MESKQSDTDQIASTCQLEHCKYKNEFSPTGKTKDVRTTIIHICLYIIQSWQRVEHKDAERFKLLRDIKSVYLQKVDIGPLTVLHAFWLCCIMTGQILRTIRVSYRKNRWVYYQLGIFCLLMVLAAALKINWKWYVTPMYPCIKRLHPCLSFGLNNGPYQVSWMQNRIPFHLNR